MQAVLDTRRAQMVRAARWSAALFTGFILITHQVIINGPLIEIDKWIHNLERPEFRGVSGFIIRRLDDLGLRGVTATALLTWGVLAYLIYRYAHVDRYRGRLASAGVATISLTVCIVSLVRDTHWFSDLLGGLFIGASLLVLVIAVDRYYPSNSQRS